jgi:hypothetical protein
VPRADVAVSFLEEALTAMGVVVPMVEFEATMRWRRLRGGSWSRVGVSSLHTGQGPRAIQHGSQVTAE